MSVKVAQSCPTLCDPMDHSPPSSSVHGILQARMLEWVAVPFFTGSSQPRDQTHVSCIAGGFFTVWATREALICWKDYPFPIELPLLRISWLNVWGFISGFSVLSIDLSILSPRPYCPDGWSFNRKSSGQTMSFLWLCFFSNCVVSGSFVLPYKL